MRAGQLKRRIEVQAESTSQDTMGGPVTTWSTLYSCWAKIATLRVQERYGAGNFDPQVTHRVTIRYPGPDPGIVAGMRVSYKTRAFKIQTVDNAFEDDRVLYLMCLEIRGIK